MLIAPLDWGLGHATRCIPVINALLHNGCEVIIAASGKTKTLLQNEFPNLEYIELKGYNISYSKKGFLFNLKIITQIPKILSTIKYEHNLLKEIIATHNIDAVISDNRFGIYNKNIFSVFITHQLTIKAPGILENVLRSINYKYINRFNECWVPDYAEKPYLAGVLSHPEKLPDIPVHYINPLVRFNITNSETIKYKYCFILSGPEPQRTLLENEVFSFAKISNEKIIIVRAKPDEQSVPYIKENVTIHNHLDTQTMQQAIAESEYIISRAGYTTVMEVFALQKKAVFIPTPGQTEQEYLAEYLSKEGYCYAVNHKNLDIENCLKQAALFNYKYFNGAAASLDTFINSFINKI